MWYFQLRSDNIMNSIFWSFVSCPQDRDCYSAKSFLNVSALSHLKVGVLQCFYKIIFPWVNPILLGQTGAWSIRYNPSIICHNFVTVVKQGFSRKRSKDDVNFIQLSPWKKTHGCKNFLKNLMHFETFAYHE